MRRIKRLIIRDTKRITIKNHIIRNEYGAVQWEYSWDVIIKAWYVKRREIGPFFTEWSAGKEQ